MIILLVQLYMINELSILLKNKESQKVKLKKRRKKYMNKIEIYENCPFASAKPSWKERQANRGKIT